MAKDPRDERGADDPRDVRREGDPRDERLSGDPTDEPPVDESGLFTRLAAPGAMGFGVLVGALYAYLLYENTIIDNIRDSIVVARAGISFLFTTGGAMGFSYFLIRSRGRRTLPLVAEITKLFFVLWTLIGVVFALRILAHDPPPEQAWAVIAIYFLVGAVAGTVFVFGLILFIGIRSDIGSKMVVRFPVWVADEVRWVVGLIRRG